MSLSVSRCCHSDEHDVETNKVSLHVSPRYYLVKIKMACLYNTVYSTLTLDTAERGRKDRSFHESGGQT